MKKKILFVLPRMGGGGAERVVSILANSLVEDYDVAIYTLVGGKSFYELDRRVNYTSVGISINRKNKVTTIISEILSVPKSFLSLRKTIKCGEYGIVFSMLAETDILTYVCKKSGLKFKHICSERNDPTKKSALMISILRRVYKNCSLFVGQSKKVLDFYSEIPKERTRVIPNPIDLQSLPQKTLSQKKIVAVGRLDPQKNFKLLVSSFFEVSKQFPEYNLHIYGEGPERSTLEKLINEQHMSEHVTLEGAKHNILKYIADAELFVMSSDFEGFPNALLEAVSMGLPVISTDFYTGTASDMIDGNGYIVPVNDAVAMKEAIVDFLSKDEKEKELMGQRSKEIGKKYSIDRIIISWKKAIQTM